VYLHHKNDAEAARHLLSVTRNRKHKAENQDEDSHEGSKAIRPHVVDKTSKAVTFLEESGARSTRLQTLLGQLSGSSLECAKFVYTEHEIETALTVREYP
jgi:hypothetical protein